MVRWGLSWRRVVGVLLALALLLPPMAAALFVVHAPFRDGVLRVLLHPLGWRVTVETVTVTWAPAALQVHRVTAVRPDGWYVTLRRGRVGLDPTVWWRGHVPFLTLEHPHVSWPHPSWAGDDRHTSASASRHTAAVLPTPALPFTVDRLQVTAGSVAVPATPERPAWRVQDLTLAGEQLSAQRMALTFAAQTFSETLPHMPVGTLRGRLVWGKSVHVTAQADSVAVVPLLALAGLPAQEGTLQASVVWEVSPEGGVTAQVTGRLDRLRLENGWEGSWDFSAQGREGEVQLQWEGLARPSPATAFVPTRVMARLRRTEPQWTLDALEGEIGPYVRFQGGGGLWPVMQQKLAVTLAQPFALGRWLGLPRPQGLSWSPTQPWQGTLSLTGTLADPRWSVVMESSPDTVAFRGVTVGQLSVRGNGGVQTGEAGEGGRLRFSVTLAAHHLRQGRWRADDLQVRSEGTFDPAEGRWVLSGINAAWVWRHHPFRWQGGASGTRAGPYEVAGRLSASKNRVYTRITPGKSGGVRVVLRIDETTPLPLSVWRAYLSPGWSMTGQVVGKVALEGGGDAWAGRLSAHIQEGKGSFSTPVKRGEEGEEGREAVEGEEGREAVEGGAAVMWERFTGHLAGQFLLSGGRLSRFKGRVDITDGAWLAGDYYGDVGEEAPSVSLSWVHGAPWVFKMVWSSRTIPHLKFRVSPSGTRYVGRIRVDKLDVARVFHRYLMDVWTLDRPSWAGATVGGWLGGDVRFAWPVSEPPHLTGWLELAQGTLQGPENRWRIGAIDLVLPLSAEKPQARQRKPGKLRLREIQVHGLALPSQELFPRWRGETLQWVGALRGPLLGGRGVLDRLKVAHAWSDDRTVSFSFALKEGELAVLSQYGGGPALAGALQVDMPDIQWQNGALRAKGSVVAALFGGEVRWQDVVAERLFSSSPSWRTDVTVRHIDLASLSDWLEVGSVSGRISGEVEALHMLGLEPLSFSARMATEEGEDKQRISVKAIENIQTLGSGMASGVLQRGLLSLFDSFGYRKIGFQCRLKNDTFHLRGVTRQDGKEYLVVGSLWPPRVNVVSHNSIIGWKDMVTRLRRITDAQAAGQATESTIQPGE